MWHVRSENNPADLSSRGLSPVQFLNNSKWRHGPEWFSKLRSVWPEPMFKITRQIPELKRVTCLAIVLHSDEILNCYSSLRKLKRIVVYCLRFREPHRFKGPLTVEELSETHNWIIKLVQMSAFTQDIHQLKIEQELHKKRRLLSLHPFIDSRGLTRFTHFMTRSIRFCFRKDTTLLTSSFARFMSIIITRA